MHLHNCCILRQIDKPQQQLVNIWCHRNDNHCWLVKNNKESVLADNISKYFKDMQNMYTETITTISSHSPPHNCQDCWLWQFCIEHICCFSGPSLPWDSLFEGNNIRWMSTSFKLRNKLWRRLKSIWQQRPYWASLTLQSSLSELHCTIVVWHFHTDHPFLWTFTHCAIPTICILGHVHDSQLCCSGYWLYCIGHQVHRTEYMEPLPCFPWVPTHHLRHGKLAHTGTPSWHNYTVRCWEVCFYNSTCQILII